MFIFSINQKLFLASQKHSKPKPYYSFVISNYRRYFTTLKRVKILKNLAVTIELSIINMFHSQDSKNIDELLICRINFSLKKTYLSFKTNFIEFSMIDFLPLPNFKGIEEHLIFGTNLSLNIQRF